MAHFITTARMAITSETSHKRVTACDLVEMHGTVPRRECLAAIAGAGVAAVVASVSEAADLGDRGIVTAKVFEPIGLGTPVMVIAPPGSDLESVIRTAGRGAVFPGFRCRWHGRVSRRFDAGKKARKAGIPRPTRGRI